MSAILRVSNFRLNIPQVTRLKAMTIFYDKTKIRLTTLKKSLITIGCVPTRKKPRKCTEEDEHFWLVLYIGK